MTGNGMHLFKQYAVEDHEAAARMIPVIDYGPYFGGEPGALDRVAAEVAHACQNVGFFYALNHGVGEEVIERAFAASRRFHALPLAQKLPVKLDDNNIGYLPINASVQGASTVHKATRPNQNESFFVSHDRGPDHPDVIAGKPLRGRNQWPAGLPGLRADMMAYFAALEAMCERMLPPFAGALGLPPEYLAPFFANEAHANLRFLHWPGAAHRQQLHDSTRAHRRTGARRAPALRPMVGTTDHPGDIPDQSRQHHAALVERPLSVDPAWCPQRIGNRPLFDRLLPQS